VPAIIRVALARIAVPRFSANLTLMFTEAPLLERFGAARRAGFEAVELVSPYDSPPETLARIVREERLAVSVFNLPPGDWAAGDRGMACDPRRAAEFREGVARAVEYARALGCGQVHAMAGIRPAGLPEEALRAAYLENLRFAGRELARHGLGLLVEAINGRDMPGYYLTTSRQAFDLMAEAAVPNLRFQFDAYHLQIVEGDLARTLEARLDRIGHVQIADVPGRHEPGTGEIDWRFLFRHLDRIGYRGWVGCEYRPLAGTEAGLGWRKELT
jgi:hydroxypyruvate isomerase